MIFPWILMIIGGSSVLSALPMLILTGSGFSGILFGGALIFFGYKWRQKKQIKTGNVKSLDRELLADADYSHVFEDCAIAVSTKHRQVYLADGGQSKIYDFNDIRSWRYNLESGGGVIGGGMTGAALSIRQDRQNKSNSGFFVQVKDVDNPEWQVRFPYNQELKKKLLRWMEIFEQKVNNR